MTAAEERERDTRKGPEERYGDARGKGRTCKNIIEENR